jgi:hypothetical protein
MLYFDSSYVVQFYSNDAHLLDAAACFGLKGINIF